MTLKNKEYADDYRGPSPPHPQISEEEEDSDLACMRPKKTLCTRDLGTMRTREALRKPHLVHFVRSEACEIRNYACSVQNDKPDMYKRLPVASGPGIGGQ